MGGLAIVAALLSVTEFWYGAKPFMTAVVLARAGIVHVPLLVLGAVQLWAGGLIGLAAGTLARDPPAMPDRETMIGWTIVIFVAVLAVVVMRRPEVELALPASTRTAIGGRYIALGAVIAAAVLFAAGYY